MGIPNSKVFRATGHYLSQEHLSGLSYVPNRLILSTVQNRRINITPQKETHSVLLTSLYNMQMLMPVRLTARKD